MAKIVRPKPRNPNHIRKASVVIPDKKKSANGDWLKEDIYEVVRYRDEPQRQRVWVQHWCDVKIPLDDLEDIDMFDLDDTEIERGYIIFGGNELSQFAPFPKEDYLEQLMDGLNSEWDVNFYKTDYEIQNYNYKETVDEDSIP